MSLAVVLTGTSYVFMAAAFVGYALILWDAFNRDACQGFMCLCIPFYFLYYAFARSAHPRRRLLLVLVLGGYGIAFPLQHLAAAQARAAHAHELEEDRSDARRTDVERP
jgi:hypothetical protein